MDTLRALFENNAIPAAIRTELEEAWNSKVKENRIAVTSELREEFARKFEYDKSIMAEAVESMVSDKLAEEMTEFHEDRKQLAEAKAKYAIAMRESSNLMATFVKQSLVKEVSELHKDQRSIAGKFAVFEDFIVEQLAKELAEFQEDKTDLAETKVRLVREAKTHLAKVKTNFIQRSAAAITETVEKGLRSEITQLREDIDIARKNDFGRKLFEAFSSEYMNSHLNEKSETSKLLKILDVKDRQLAEAKTFAVKARTLVESKNVQVKRLIESTQRSKAMNELVGPLNKDQKDIMTDLLESVATAKLRSAFDKYLPTVIDGKSPAKQKAQLSEAKEITGNRRNSSIEASVMDNNVVDIKRLAGLK